MLAYNGGIEWAPFDGVRLRAGIARAVRAPSLVDLYSEQSQNFADINDPCASDNIAIGLADARGELRGGGYSG